MSDSDVPFWQELERLLDDADGQAERPDPWGGAEVGEPALTDEQVAFLAGLEDQPPVPHLDDGPAGC